MLQAALEALIEDQLPTKSKFVLIKYGQSSKTSHAFNPTFRDMDLAHRWVDRLARMTARKREDDGRAL